MCVLSNWDCPFIDIGMPRNEIPEIIFSSISWGHLLGLSCFSNTFCGFTVSNYNSFATRTRFPFFTFFLKRAVFKQLLTKKRKTLHGFETCNELTKVWFTFYEKISLKKVGPFLLYNHENRKIFAFFPFLKNAKNGITPIVKMDASQPLSKILFTCPQRRDVTF